jgi:hypothetical protein
MAGDIRIHLHQNSKATVLNVVMVLWSLVPGTLPLDELMQNVCAGHPMLHRDRCHINHTG